MSLLKTIVDAGLITPPCDLRALANRLSVTAQLTTSGEIDFAGQRFKDVDSAMKSALRLYPEPRLLPRFVANGWQFWGWLDPHRETWTPLEHARARYESRDQQASLRTSESHPLRIDELSLPGCKGRLGLTFCPGKTSDGLYGGHWQRDLNNDIARITHWGATTAITLLENQELYLLEVPDLPQAFRRAGIQWVHAPIADMQVPDKNFQRQWASIRPVLHQRLQDGENILLHCRGGLGRTGLVAAQMLVECGCNPVEAVAQVRGVRPHSIETFAQEEYILLQGNS